MHFFIFIVIRVCYVWETWQFFSFSFQKLGLGVFTKAKSIKYSTERNGGHALCYDDDDDINGFCSSHCSRISLVDTLLYF